MGTELEEKLLRTATEEALAAEGARQLMLQASSRRQEAIFGLHVSGASVRAIASQLGCSPAVVQNAIRQARNSRPHMERRETRVAYELHRVVANRLDVEPQPVLERGRRNLDRMRLQRRDSLSIQWIDEWRRLLDGSIVDLKTAMLDIGHHADDMRQMSPFAGVLSQDERLLAIRKASRSAA